MYVRQERSGQTIIHILCTADLTQIQEIVVEDESHALITNSL